MFVILLLCAAGGSLATYGMFLVISNTVHVDLRYTIALSFSVRGSVVSLTATVRYNGRPAGVGINVDFYYSVNGSDWNYFTTQTTNHGGIARTKYTITVNGEYDFKAAISFH